MTDKAPDIYVYKMTTDNGGAPCVYRNLLSLAICKPKIRKTAAVGSLVFGFGGQRHGERLIYIARITGKLEGDQYYTGPEYARRPDRIYRRNGLEAKLRPGARFHTDEDHRRKDVGLNFENAFVLISRDFRYFGINGSADYKQHYPAIRRLIEGLTQGHRRNHSETLRKELLALKEEMWHQYLRIRLGGPSDASAGEPCNDDAPCRIC